MTAAELRDRATFPRVALSREEAAASMGMSVDHFERHVQPTIRMVRVGRKVIVPVDELRRWLADRAERVLP
jgi:excisionase family DNA binding protein